MGVGTATKTEDVQSVLEGEKVAMLAIFLLLKVLTILYLLDIFEGCQDCQHSLSGMGWQSSMGRQNPSASGPPSRRDRMTIWRAAEQRVQLGSG